MTAHAILEPVRLRAPFPWFGGKSRAAPIIWRAFGNVANYVEPFAGSLATLIARPHAPRVETVNDLDCYLANFWRAVQHAPDDVARWADWPVNEADLHARHRWLVDRLAFRERMKTEPEYFDAKIAGWWVWGLCQWIGGGWCSHPEWSGRTNAGCAPKGVHAAVIERKRPVIGRGGRGILSSAGNGLARQLPDLSGDSGATGRGIHASGISRRLPRADRGTDSRLQTDAISDWMRALCERLRRVRVCCGDWTRIVGPAVTTCIGTTGVLLDPPYAASTGRDVDLYAREDGDVAHAVRARAIEHGDNPKLRIALCGYEGEHVMPASWRCVPWRAQGGYGNASHGLNRNRHRERVWLSPACLSDGNGPLFAGAADVDEDERED